MNKWIPTIITVLTTIASSQVAQEWISTHPQAAVYIAGLYAVIKGMLPSPMEGVKVK